MSPGVSFSGQITFQGYFPVPLSGTKTKGSSGSLEKIAILREKDPLASGLKRILRETVPPGFTVKLVMAPSTENGGSIIILVISSLAPPLFWTFNVRVLDLPTTTLPQLIFIGVRLISCGGGGGA